MNHIRSQRLFKTLLCCAALLIAQLQPAILPAFALEAGTQTSQAVTPEGLSAEAMEVAQLLGVTQTAQALMQIRRTSAGAPVSDQELALKVELLDKILGGVLEVRMVSDRIDRELSWSYMGQGMLLGKRQRDLNYLFSANFMQGGVLGIIAGCEFLHGKPKAGSELLLCASSIGLFLSTLSFIEQRRGSKHIDGEVNVLADVYSLPQKAKLQHNPEVVMKYLNSVPPRSVTGKTRREELIAMWKRGHYLGQTDEAHLNKLASIKSETGDNHENINLMGNRIRMLYDTQWSVEQLDAGLLALLRETDLQ